MRYRNESNLISCIVFRPVGLRFRPVGLRFRPVGLRFRPVGLRFRPVGLRFRPQGLRSSVFVFGSSFSTHPLQTAFLAQCVGMLYWKAGKAWRREFESRGLQTHVFFFFSFFPPTCFFFLFLFPMKYEIARTTCCWHSSNYLITHCFTCFTSAEPFDDIFLFVKWSCALISGNTNKSLWPIDRPNERPSE